MRLRHQRLRPLVHVPGQPVPRVLVGEPDEPAHQPLPRRDRVLAQRDAPHPPDPPDLPPRIDATLSRQGSCIRWARPPSTAGRSVYRADTVPPLPHPAQQATCGNAPMQFPRVVVAHCGVHAAVIHQFLKHVDGDTDIGMALGIAVPCVRKSRVRSGSCGV